MKIPLGILGRFALAGMIGGAASYRSGGDLQFELRMARDIASRQPTEPIRTASGSGPSPNAALMSGQVWRDFCARLEQAGEQILREDVPGDPRTRLVRLDPLDREVPPQALRVSPAQRSEQIEARRRAVQRRFQRG